MQISIWFNPTKTNIKGRRKTLKNISGIYSGISKNLGGSHVMLFASEKDNIIKTYYTDQIKKVTIKPKEEKR